MIAYTVIVLRNSIFGSAISHIKTIVVETDDFAESGAQSLLREDADQHVADLKEKFPEFANAEFTYHYSNERLWKHDDYWS